MNVNKKNDKPDKSHESFTCPELGGHIHLSTDLILADLLDELSRETHSKVVSHIESCHECAEVRELAKKALISKPESDEGAIESGSPRPLDVKIRSRVEFFAMLNTRRAQIINMMLKLLVPQARRLVTTDERHFLSLPTVDSKSSSQPEDNGDTDAVQEIVDFVVYLLDLIMERFSDAEQMQQGLPACIDDAIEMLDMAKYDAQARIKIRGMLLHFLCEDNE